MNYIDKLCEAHDTLSPGISTCQGCGIEIILRRILKLAGPNSILSLPPGCSAGAGTMGTNTLMGTEIPVHISLLGNLGALMSGVTAAYQNQGRTDVNIIAFAGDGASADCGFQSLSGAAERGEKMLYICYDNEGYMNTGFQRSSTTPIGASTSTTPAGSASGGKIQQKKDLPRIMAMHNVEYVATLCPSHMADFVSKVEKGLAASKRGFSYLHIFCPCPTGWGFEPNRTIQIARMAVNSNCFPLYEVESGNWKRNVKVSHPIPIREYGSSMKKFRHLTDAQYDKWQSFVDSQNKFIDTMCQEH